MKEAVGSVSPVSPSGHASAQQSTAAQSFPPASSLSATMPNSSSCSGRGLLDESEAAGRLLPVDYEEILSRAVTPVGYSSKSELYHLLCGSILIDGGQKSFSLERSTGKKCFLLSATVLGVAWAHHRGYWRWRSQARIPGRRSGGRFIVASRFSQVAELIHVCWLHIYGKMEVRELSPRTLYAAYLVFRLKEGSSYGLDGAQKATVAVGAYTSHRTVCLEPSGAAAAEQNPVDGVPRPRGDGWMELELGEFTVPDVTDDAEAVNFGLQEVERLNWKGGLLVEGVELRPKVSGIPIHTGNN